MTTPRTADLPDLPAAAPPHPARPAGAHDGCDCGRGAARPDRWQAGFTRRRLLQGGAALVAALGEQQVTTRLAFAAPAGQAAAPAVDVLVVVSLRGGWDALNAVVPAFDPAYYRVRPNIAIPQRALLPLDGRFGLHPALADLRPFWADGRLAVVHAVGTPDQTLSHFEAMDTVERGTATGAADGWLNRVLQVRADTGVFSAVQVGTALPTSLTGPAPALAVDGIDSFGLGGLDYIRTESTRALRALYADYRHPMTRQVTDTLRAMATTDRLRAKGYTPAAAYPDGYFGTALREVARLVKAGVGLTVATLDVGGWDTHTGQGGVSGGLADSLAGLGAGLAAFLTDLGPRADNVVLAVISEFGRTLHSNDNAGTDHGRGQAMLLLGGGVRGGRVYGRWPGLDPHDGYDNCLPGTTDYRSVLAEVLRDRCGVGNLAAVFPDHRPTPVGTVRPG